MDEPEMNVAIAEACGWKIDPKSFAPWNWLDPDGRISKLSFMPNYTRDLNAMHEAENVIMEMDEGWVNYTNHLGMSSIAPDRRIVRATALQRAEAFLRTIGKFTPTPKPEHE